MYKARIMISIFQGWLRKIPGSYTLVAGFLICHYTCQYTSCILCKTGGILAGLWKVCIRKLHQNLNLHHLHSDYFHDPRHHMFRCHFC